MNRDAYTNAVKAINNDDDRYVGIGFPLGFNVDGRMEPCRIFGYCPLKIS